MHYFIDIFSTLKFIRYTGTRYNRWWLWEMTVPFLPQGALLAREDSPVHFLYIRYSYSFQFHSPPLFSTAARLPAPPQKISDCRGSCRVWLAPCWRGISCLPGGKPSEHHGSWPEPLHTARWQALIGQNWTPPDGAWPGHCGDHISHKSFHFSKSLFFLVFFLPRAAWRTRCPAGRASGGQGSYRADAEENFWPCEIVYSCSSGELNPWPLPLFPLCAPKTLSGFSFSPGDKVALMVNRWTPFYPLFLPSFPLPLLSTLFFSFLSLLSPLYSLLNPHFYLIFPPILVPCPSPISPFEFLFSPICFPYFPLIFPSFPPISLLLWVSLGATPPMEVLLCTGWAKTLLQSEHGVSVARIVSGALMTSLDMAGTIPYMMYGQLTSNGWISEIENIASKVTLPQVSEIISSKFSLFFPPIFLLFPLKKWFFFSSAKSLTHFLN